MKFGLFASALVLTTTACAAHVAPAGDDDLGVPVEAEDDLVTGNANFGFFTVTHRDMRKCMWPICGGYFVKRVNQKKTVCVDGSLAAECYIASISFPSMNLTERETSDFKSRFESGQALVRAKTYKTKINGATFGTLKATEAWTGASGATPDGTFYRVSDNGIRCIKAPCPSMTAAALNGHDRHNLIDVILTNTTPLAPTDLLEQARSSLMTEQGILLAGSILLPKCIPGSNCGPKAVASEFYLPFKHSEGELCGGRGMKTCSLNQYCNWNPKDICGAADAPGKCAYRPEMCITLFKPVCGCDGKTYSNACAAAAAGASVSSEGACSL